MSELGRIKAINTTSIQSDGLADLRDEVKELQATIATLTQQLAQAQADNETLKLEVDTLTQQEESWEADLKQAQAERDTPQRLVTKLSEELNQRRATLDAAPVNGTSIIGKGEPPSQWDPNAQVRGDIS